MNHQNYNPANEMAKEFIEKLQERNNPKIQINKVMQLDRYGTFAVRTFKLQHDNNFRIINTPLIEVINVENITKLSFFNIETLEELNAILSDYITKYYEFNESRGIPVNDIIKNV